MIPEWGLDGAARVLEIKPCPEIRPGPGRLVLMKSTTQYTGDMATITLVGSCDAITGTSGHPIFSIDRTTYVDLGDLMPGERVRTADGWATVEAMSRWRGQQEVYNLEVDSEHRFFVGGSKVESHNAGPCGKTYITYTKPGPNGDSPYAGRASGYGTPDEILAARDAAHHMNARGFGQAELDRVTKNKAAWRGREQHLIDKNGGAQRSGGTSGNIIRGVSPSNPNAKQYDSAARKEFGVP